MICDNWLALVIGNSRLHWGYFSGAKLQQAWDSSHSGAIEQIQEAFPGARKHLWRENIPIYLASVVPSLTKLYAPLPQVQLIERKHVPLKGIYSTMGIDRALALWGAGRLYGFPCLVIDAGTALTLTGADGEQELVGGAILPGVKLQLDSLGDRAADLPSIGLREGSCQRWAVNTEDAIYSGILYTIVAGIRAFSDDWLKEFPGSSILLTGGDANLLSDWLQRECPQLAEKIVIDPNLVFWGIEGVKQLGMCAPNSKGNRSES